MYICKSCGQTYSEPVKFCGKCGSDSFEASIETPAYEANPAYSNPAPAYSYAPTPESGSKAPSIVGMVLGIVATFLALIMTGFIGELVDSYYSRYYSDEIFVSFIVWSFFVLPFAIVGLIMSFKKSSLKAMSIVGKITSFVSLGLWLISFLMTVSNM